MAKGTEARVLLDHDGFKINSVISGEDADRGIAEGWADGEPAAVKYAKALAKEAPAEESCALESTSGLTLDFVEAGRAVLGPPPRSAPGKRPG